MKIKDSLIAKVLENLKFDSLNEIQTAMINKGLQADNIVLHSPTGTGKTVAFLLPLLHNFKPDSPGIQALILVPSRELALQIEQVFRDMNTGFKVNCCYGGHPIKTEKNNFIEPPVLLIGTPGRIADHLRRDNFKPDTIQCLVLDEFDKSLEMGFSEEMSYIINRLSNIKKRILTSATRAIEIPVFTGVTNPVTLDFLDGNDQPKIIIKAVRAKEKDKLDVLIRLICHLGNEPTLVFCNHREAVDRISGLLDDMGMVHDTFHGGLEQDERERALIKFRNGSHHLLVTTDLASRGLDIPEIKNIIHYQITPTPSVYIHRNGRTARMDAEGTAWLVLSETEALPSYLNESPVYVELPQELLPPNPPKWITLYIGGGKKDKINKIDIVGFLIKQGRLQKEDIGLIVVQDNSSFAAVNRNKVHKALTHLKDQKLKNKKVKIEISE
jgi:superfamily II DNA/RNA helicase